jgi:hypothetical protein
MKRDHFLTEKTHPVLQPDGPTLFDDRARHCSPRRRLISRSMRTFSLACAALISAFS